MLDAAVLEDGNTEIISGRYLVGCDGGRSTIRKLADIEFDGFTWPEETMESCEPRRRRV